MRAEINLTGQNWMGSKRKYRAQWFEKKSTDKVLPSLGFEKNKGHGMGEKLRNVLSETKTKRHV